MKGLPILHDLNGRLQRQATATATAEVQKLKIVKRQDLQRIQQVKELLKTVQQTVQPLKKRAASVGVAVVRALGKFIW